MKTFSMDFLTVTGLWTPGHIRETVDASGQMNHGCAISKGGGAFDAQACQPNQATRVHAAGTLYQIETALNRGDAPLAMNLLSDLVR